MRNLDSLGYIKGHCGLLTDPEIMNRARHNLELANYIAEIKWIEDDASSDKKDEHETKMIELVPKAEKLLTKSEYTVVADLC